MEGVEGVGGGGGEEVRSGRGKEEVWNTMLLEERVGRFEGSSE